MKLLALLIHSLFPCPQAADPTIMDVQQQLTVSQLEYAIQWFKYHNACFPDPRHLNGSEEQLNVLLTLDDGYANNLLALPVLARHRVPAVFFITTQPVQTGAGFWWDVVHREELARGTSPAHIRRVIRWAKQGSPFGLEAFLRSRYGDAAHQPDPNDVSRPMTIDEVQTLSAHPYAHIGNHTHRHAILTRTASHDTRQELQLAHQLLTEWTQRAPSAVAYPNGNHNADVIQQVCDLGYAWGITTCKGFNRRWDPRDLGTPRAMRLERMTLWGNQSIEKQCQRWYQRATRTWLS